MRKRTGKSSNFVRNQPPKAVEGILATVGQQLGLEAKIQEWAVLALWSQLVPAPFQSQTHAQRIVQKGREKHLMVKADHAAVAAELTFYLETLREKLNTYASETGLKIDRIILR